MRDVPIVPSAAGHLTDALIGGRDGLGGAIDDLLDGAGGDADIEHGMDQLLHIDPAHGLDAAKLCDKRTKPQSVAGVKRLGHLGLDDLAAPTTLPLVQDKMGGTSGTSLIISIT